MVRETTDDDTTNDDNYNYLPVRKTAIKRFKDI